MFLNCCPFKISRNRQSKMISKNELLTVFTANLGAWSLALTDVELIARIISLLVAAAYTVVKICQATKTDGK